MSKLSKSTKTVIIAAAVLLLLGAVLMVLMLTKPSDEQTSSSDAESEVHSDVSTAVDITDKQAENVLSMTVKNAEGEFSLQRGERFVSTEDDEGNVSTSTEYFWTSPEMLSLTPNSTTVSAFVRSMASLTTKELVETNAADLEKYGLENPLSQVSVKFDDGTSAELCFGIQNPVSTSQVYFRTADSRDVHLVSYYSVGSAFYSVRDFVSLVMTEAYNAEARQELDYLIIERKDMEQPAEIRYMYDLEALADSDDVLMTTFNTHRFVSPLNTEVDTTKGQSVCYGLYGLTMSSCVYLEKTEEALAATGLDDPFAVVTFKYGGKHRVLSLGDKVTVTTEGDEDTPALTSVTGYYAMLDGVEGIYTIAKDSAPWYTFTIQNIIARRPLSPYIYTVDTLTITTKDGEYDFKIEGNADSHTYSLDGKEVDDEGFRELYQFAIAAVGEELYFDDPTGTPIASLHFKYRSSYADVYGRDEDIVEFYPSDDRKNIVRVNGTTLFKVREVYTDRLAVNVQALINGESVELNW